MCGHIAGVGSLPLHFKGHPLPVAGDYTGFGNLDFLHTGLDYPFIVESSIHTS